MNFQQKMNAELEIKDLQKNSGLNRPSFRKRQNLSRKRHVELLYVDPLLYLDSVNPIDLRHSVNWCMYGRNEFGTRLGMLKEGRERG